MTTISITDLPASHARRELFWEGALCVVSRSGLHETEKRLLDQLAHLPTVPASLLIAGNRTGATALAAATRFADCAVTCHAFDLHHARAILRNLGANGRSAVLLHDPFATLSADLRTPPSESRPAFTVACTSQVPPATYDAALFMATPGTMTGELVLDQLEDIHRNLALGGTCVLACEAESAPLLKQVKAIFGNCAVAFDRKGVVCASAVKREPLNRARDFSAQFSASLAGGAPLSLGSLPGVFCHRRPDNGGLALAEIAARELQPNQRVLDMGCGCGLVGLLLARSQPGTRVTFIDSHARALAATHRNLTALGLGGHALELSDTGTREAGFDLFAGNPPYYSDFKIATLFIDTARAALRTGGVCLLVAKSTTRLEAAMRAAFGNAEVVPRRGYGIVRGVR